MMWIWIAAASLLGLVALVFLVGTLLPERTRARGRLDVPLSPAEVWRRLADFERHPMSAGMCRGTERLPDENGLPVWIEDLGSSKFRVQTVEAEEPRRIVRRMTDQVVPMTARSVIELEAIGSGTRLTMETDVTLARGTWHVPVMRVTLALFRGVRGGIKGYLGRIAGAGSSVPVWE